MNIFARHCLLVLLIALLLDLIEIGAVPKVIRPYKYYQRRPLQRPRWYSGYKSSKFHHSKRIPPEDYYFDRPSYYRYASGMTRDNFDARTEDNPYTIVIQLPKAENKYGPNYLKRKRQYGSISIPTYNSDEYIDDDDDFESRMVNNKKVLIKMIKGESPKLHIQVSRSDNDKSLRIADISNTTALPEMYNENLRMQQPITQNWASPRFAYKFGKPYQPF